MQANKYFTLATASLISLSLLCTCHCQADVDDKNITKVCSATFYNISVQGVCNQALRSYESNKTCGPSFSFPCMVRFVNAKAINATKYFQAVAVASAADAAPGGGNGTKRAKNIAETCRSNCLSATDHLNKCEKVYNRSNKTLSNWIKSNLQTSAGGAETDLNTCADEFKVKSDNFTEASKAALGLISVELAIINLYL